ncbi:MAG TPA: radical SAM protein [Syntrophales bacterium]|nr:radical SAM protein [Syntrophales bacterium]
MSEAGFRSIFLGIENVSNHNLRTMGKADIVKEAKKAIENCHRHGIMVIGGLIFGLPDDNEEAIRKNYQFLNELEADASYCQMLTPYPKTRLRDYLIDEGLVTNHDRYERYSGFWANVKTRHLESDELQYSFWYNRETALGWWKPSAFAGRQGRLWMSFWTYMAKPIMKFFTESQILRIGWDERYQRYIRRLEMMNRFDDLEMFKRN